VSTVQDFLDQKRSAYKTYFLDQLAPYISGKQTIHRQFVVKMDLCCDKNYFQSS